MFFCHKISIFLIITFCASGFVLATLSAKDLPQQPLDRILQQKNSEQQQEKLFKKPTGEEKTYLENATKKDVGSCVVIDKILFEGANHLSFYSRNHLTKTFIGQCISSFEIGEILNKIINHYISNGYTTTRVYFDHYNYKNRTIYFKVAEGKIHSLVLNNIKTPSQNPFCCGAIKNEDQNQEQNPDKNKDQQTRNISESLFDKTQIFFAFPARKGKTFDMNDAEQGISQMNHLRSNNANIEIRPSKAEGESDIIINNYKNNNSLELGINYDNAGSKSTGIYNTTYSINQDNLLKINDNLNFSQIRSSSSITNLFGASVPFGYYSFNYSHSANEYSAQTDNGVKISGTSTNNDLGINRLILRKKSHELNLNTNLNFRNSTRKNAGVVDISSQKLSTARIGVDYTLRQEKFILSLGLTYSKGLSLNGAIDDKKDSNYPLQQDSPRAQFKKWAYNLNLYKPLGKYLRSPSQI